MKRMYSLDVLRLVFAYIIALFHVGIHISPGSVVCIEVFFIISGYFLARKFYATRDREYTQWDYTIDHARSLYPHYIFSVAVFFLYVAARSAVMFLRAPSWGGIYEIFLLLYNQIPDVLFLQSAYHFHTSLNYPLWQISALVISGYFVFGLLRLNEKNARMLIFPACILMARSIINTGIPSDQNFGPIYMNLLFAFYNICIGVLAFYFTTTQMFQRFRCSRILFNLASVAALVCIFFFGEYDIMHLILTPLIIYGCMEETSWINRVLNKPYFKNFGFFSYLIYVNHAIIQRFAYAVLFARLENWGISLSIYEKGAVYAVLVTVYSLATIPIVKYLKQLLSRKKLTAEAPVA